MYHLILTASSAVVGDADLYWRVVAHLKGLPWTIQGVQKLQHRVATYLVLDSDLHRVGISIILVIDAEMRLAEMRLAQRAGSGGGSRMWKEHGPPTHHCSPPGTTTAPTPSTTPCPRLHHSALHPMPYQRALGPRKVESGTSLGNHWRYPHQDVQAA